MKNFTFAAIALCAGFFVSSCQKDSAPALQGQDGADYFNFATTHVCKLAANYNVNDNAMLVEVYGENPIVIVDGIKVKKGIKPLFRVITDANGKVNEQMDLPTYLKEVYLYTDCFGVPSPVKVQVTETGVSFDMTKPDTKSAPATRTATSTWPSGMLRLGDWDGMGLPDYLIGRSSLPPYILKNLAYTFPETVNTTTNHPEFFAPGVQRMFNVVNETEITMTFLHYGGVIYNTVGYYTYPTAGPAPSSLSDIKQIIAFPNASTYGERGALSAGDAIKLKYWNGTSFQDKFPAGVTIGFFMGDGAFELQTGNIKYPGRFFSNVNLKVSDGQHILPANNQQHVLLRDRNSKLLILGMEDINRPYGDQDFNDAVFYFKTTSYGDIDDTDIPDIIPNPTPDPDPSLNYTEYSGLLAYEDLWPYQGDYDLNDVVIEYHCTVYRNAQNRVVKTVDKFKPVVSIAGYEDGFGYQMKANSYYLNPSTPGSGTTVTPEYTSPTSLFKIDYNGLEKDQREITIMLWENMHDVLNKGIGEFTVTNVFTQPLSSSSIFPPYNPFIVCNTNVNKGGGRGVEVHLPDQKPSDLANVSLLGRGLDRSMPSMNKYYISTDYFPFAIKIPVSNFKITRESQRIDIAYPKFTNWARTKGAEDADWYLHPAL